MSAEVIVVDNGSTDYTHQVVEGCRIPHAALRYVNDPTPGAAHARNVGIAAAKGRAILFTDDDMRVPSCWIEGMSEPIFSGRAEAVAGGIRIPRHLAPAWLGPLHRGWMGCTQGLSARTPVPLCSASLALSRGILAKVTGFDPMLGPGALGAGEDSLLSYQVERAGYRLAFAADVIAEHHFSASRLSRRCFLEMASTAGRVTAYIAYHWTHSPGVITYMAFSKWIGRFVPWYAKAGYLLSNPAGGSLIEIYLAMCSAYVRQYRWERKHARAYKRFGLVKQVA